ncbi:serine hydroxymethyltransferase [Promethearchaeum syntrophicum]|uniref:Serine hydroxymethyltransferase n=2 Tax=Promethearchaeum syntrophicum TaxID=2594042 RepID=A0A5B9D9R9_9ARCH|nr:serine hydroxymethyltransferase [Candidatus Prometheoarchaeum syntrophicum]QEE15761.1 Serine hydroxymethyltransferase [Candidatus Prometheoarchaeum syntrophicum]
MNLMNEISISDPKVADAINREIKRQEEGIELIPSENYTSRAVLQAVGSVFTNKYSEGYPAKRYYGGNEIVDEIESLAIERAKELFGCEHVNVQPYSGSPANQAVYFALLNLKDKFLGFNLTSGGHLTHGSHVNFSGKNYTCVSYDVDPKTEMLDMDAVRKLAIKEQPKMILSGLTAYPRKIDFKAFQEIAEEVNAYHMSDIAHIAGLVAGGVHQSPIPYADVVTTTTHKSLRGPRGAMIMCKTEDRLHDLYHSNSKKNLAQLIDSAVFPGLQGGPHDHVNAAKAVCFGEALKPDFKVYAQQIVNNAKALAEELMALGIKLVSNGTDNHLILIDMRPEGLTGEGKLIQNALDHAGLTVNKNTVPYEPSTPFNPSGIRLGTPAITSRGMKESEMKVIASGLARVIKSKGDLTVSAKVKEEILELTKEFPVYPGLAIFK